MRVIIKSLERRISAVENLRYKAASVLFLPGKSEPFQFIDKNDTVYGIWNTSVGQDSWPASSGYSTGQYWHLDSPSYVFDGNLTNEYCSYGYCNWTTYEPQCGEKTGLYVTSQRGAFILDSFIVVKGHTWTNRDPTVVTIEGSNESSANLALGSSWTLLYNGTAGIDPYAGLHTPGEKQMLSNNTIAFASYRFLVSAKRGNQTCVEYSEIQFFGLR